MPVFNIPVTTHDDLLEHFRSRSNDANPVSCDPHSCPIATFLRDTTEITEIAVWPYPASTLRSNSVRATDPYTGGTVRRELTTDEIALAQAFDNWHEVEQSNEYTNTELLDFLTHYQVP